MSAPYRHGEDHEPGVGPYLVIAVVALVIGLSIAIYVAGYRDEIIAILTQSPT